MCNITGSVKESLKVKRRMLGLLNKLAKIKLNEDKKLACISKTEVSTNPKGFQFQSYFRKQTKAQMKNDEIKKREIYNCKKSDNF